MSSLQPGSASQPCVIVFTVRSERGLASQAGPGLGSLPVVTRVTGPVGGLASCYGTRGPFRPNWTVMALGALSGPAGCTVQAAWVRTVRSSKGASVASSQAWEPLPSWSDWSLLYYPALVRWRARRCGAALQAKPCCSIMSPYRRRTKPQGHCRDHRVSVDKLLMIQAQIHR